MVRGVIGMMRGVIGMVRGTDTVTVSMMDKQTDKHDVTWSLTKSNAPCLDTRLTCKDVTMRPVHRFAYPLATSPHRE